MISKEDLRNQLLQIPHQQDLLNAYKKSLSPLTQLQFDIGIGVMLGDVSLQSQDGGQTYRLKFEQGEKHKDYIDHLYLQFKEFCLSEPKSQTRTNAAGNPVTNWTFQTISHSAFVPLADIFFNQKNPNTGNGKKTITKDLIEKFVSPTAMAYWFMDDGGKMDYSKNEGKGLVFNCHGFQEEEVDYLVNGLKSRYTLNCWKKKIKENTLLPFLVEHFHK